MCISQLECYANSSLAAGMAAHAEQVLSRWPEK